MSAAAKSAGAGSTAWRAAPAVIVHDLAQALAAAAAAEAAGRPLVLLTPEQGLFAQGPGFWAALQRRLGSERPKAPVRLLVDCDDAPGLAQAAQRCGLRWLVFRGEGPAAERLAALLATAGGRLERRPPPALDLLGQPDPQSAAAAHLQADRGAAGMPQRR